MCRLYAVCDEGTWCRVYVNKQTIGSFEEDNEELSEAYKQAVEELKMSKASPGLEGVVCGSLNILCCRAVKWPGGGALHDSVRSADRCNAHFFMASRAAQHEVDLVAL